jgi:molecular chaperone DnaK (HSP70)
MRLVTVVFCVAAALFVAADESKEDLGTVIGIDLGTTYSW